MTRFRNIGLMILLLIAGRMAAQVPVIDSVCSGAERFYRVSGEAGSTYSWILTEPGGNVTALPSVADTLQMVWNYSAGIYNLQVIQHPLNGCDADAVYAQVIIFESPAVFAGDTGIICETGYYHLVYATAENTSSILWTSSGDGTFDNDTLLDATYTPGPGDILAGSVTLTLTGLGLGDEGTCDPAVSSMIIIITTEVIPEFVDLGTICQYSEPPVLPATSINGISGTWEPPVINTSVPGVFIFTFTPDSGECAIPMEIRVTVNEIPVVYAGEDQIIPIYTSTTISDASATGNGPLVFNWMPPEFLVDPNVMNPTTIALPSTTTFIFRVADSVGCVATDTVTIYIKSEPLAVDPTALPDTICAGEAVQLSANATGGSGTYSYSWISDPPGFISDLPDPMAYPMVTTTYIIEVDDGFYTVTDSVVVEVNPLPEVYAGSDQLIPVGTNTTIGDATASGAEPLVYSWTPAGLLVDPTVLNPVTVDLFATQIFTLTVTDNNGCSRSDAMTIYVSSGPLTVNPVADPDTMCQNGYAQLYANANGGSGNYTYLWTSDPPGFSSVQENPVVSPTITTTYTVEVNDGFTVVSGSVTVVVIPFPEVYAGADQTIPIGTGTTIGDATATGTAPLIYYWSPEELLLDPTVLNPTTVNLFTDTVLTLTVTDAFGCSSSDAMTIFVEGLPLLVTPTADPAMVCAGSPVQLFANASGGTGTYTYDWTSDPPGFTSTVANPIVNPMVSTTYTVEVSDGDTIVSGDVYVAVNSLPVVFAGADQIIPVGTATTINDAMASGAVPMIYLWSPGNLLVDSTALHPTTLILFTTTTFTLTVIDSNGCINSDEVIIFVEGSPLQVNPTAENDSICLGESTQLFANAMGGSGSYSYSWTSDPPGFTSVIDNPVVTPVVTTIYTVTVTDGFSVATGEVTVVVNPLPTVTCPATMVACEDTLAIALNEATPAGGQYSGTGVYLDNGIYYFKPLYGAGSYSITYFYTDINGCSNSCEFEIIITENPQVTQTIVTDETDGQQNGAIEIFATGITAQLYYSINNGTTWQVNNGLFENLAAGTYMCIVMDENGCDTTFVIEVENNILTALEAITGSDTLCLGEMSTVPVKVNQFNSVAEFQLKMRYNTDKLQFVSYTNPQPMLAQDLVVYSMDSVIFIQWSSDAPVTFAVIETVCELAFTSVEPGSGELEWYISPLDSYFMDLSGNPIPAEFYAGQVIIYDPPELLIPDEVTLCEGDTLSLKSAAIATNPPLSYLWRFPDGNTQVEDPFISSVTIDDAGYYTLTVTDALGCTDQNTVHVVIGNTPVSDFHDTDTLTIPPGYTLDAGSGKASYLWNTGEIGQSIKIFTEGWYSVTMESWAGCIGTDSVYILLVPPECLWIPNAFTPNADGLNDTFRPVTICPVIAYKMLIYNRWGEKLFESRDISRGWDGTKDGVKCPGDAYVYLIHYAVEEGQGKQKEDTKYGIVVLLK